MAPTPQWLCTVARDGRRISQVSTLGERTTPAPATSPEERGSDNRYLVQNLYYFQALLLQMFLVSGGYEPYALDSTEIFDSSLGSWIAGTALPSRRNGLRATNIDNRVLLFGNTFY